MSRMDEVHANGSHQDAPDPNCRECANPWTQDDDDYNGADTMEEHRGER